MKDLDRAEWNFEHVPAHELQACLTWEFSRELVLSWRLDTKDIKGAYLGNSAHFPSKPWLKIPANERYKMLEGRSRVAYRLELEPRPGETFPYTWEQNVVAIAIDWRLADSTLSRKFEAILQERRREIGAKQKGDRRGDTQSKGSIQKLKALGARRIWKACDRNFGRIFKKWDEDDWLYSDEANWAKALKRCDANLDSFQVWAERKIASRARLSSLTHPELFDEQQYTKKSCSPP
jgi:hypothetical protein